MHGYYLPNRRPDDTHLQIWLRNKVSIPHTADIHEVFATQSQPLLKKYQDFLTDALIVNCQPKLRPNDLKTIKAGVGIIDHAAIQNSGQLLNEIIAAHQIVRLGPYISCLDATWPRMLYPGEIFERMLYEVTLITEPNRIIDQNIILNLLSDTPSGSCTRMAGDLRDFSKEQISALKLAVSKVRKHAFYELKTKAIAAMLSRDSIVAIVLGCAALEGAHGFYMRLALRNKIPGDTGKFNTFMNSLLREQGFLSCSTFRARAYGRERTAH